MIRGRSEVSSIFQLLRFNRSSVHKDILMEKHFDLRYMWEGGFALHFSFKWKNSD